MAAQSGLKHIMSTCTTTKLLRNTYMINTMHEN